MTLDVTMESISRGSRMWKGIIKGSGLPAISVMSTGSRWYLK